MCRVEMPWGVCRIAPNFFFSFGLIGLGAVVAHHMICIRDFNFSYLVKYIARSNFIKISEGNEF